MASTVEVRITIDGKKLESFVNLGVRLDISQLNFCTLTCRPDAFDKFSASASSFVLEKAKDLIGKKVKVEITPIGKNNSGGNITTIFSGMIREIQGTKFNDAFSGAIQLKCSSAAFLLQGDVHCRSFEKKKLDEIVKAVLKDYSSNLFDKKEISSRYKESIPFVVQYNETNFEFLQRLARKYGEWLLITANNHLFFGEPPEDKSNLLHGKDLSEFSYSMKIDPFKFSFTSYNYFDQSGIEKGSEAFQARASGYLKNALDASEEIFQKKGNFYYSFPLSKDQADKEVEAGVKTDKLTRLSRLTVASGSSDNPDANLGYILKIEGLTDAGKKISFGEFRVISIYHSVDEGGNYINHFDAVPATIDLPPQTNTFVHPRCETQSAIVTDTDDPEGLGRIRVRFLWQKKEDESPWLRVVTPYAGNKMGFFFIPEVDEEVLIGFHGNNAEFPYVMGAHYNGKKKPSDWKSDKNYKKSLRTKAGHTIEFNDENGKEEIIIYDKDKVNTVTLSSHDKRMTISCKGDLTIEAQNIDITAQKDYKLEVKGKIESSSMKDTEIQATGNCEIKSKKNIEIEAMSNLKAKANAKAEVSGATLAAKGSAKAELSAGGQTVVKGGIVQIN